MHLQTLNHDRKTLYELWLKLKFVTVSFGKLNARWKRCPKRIGPILQGYCLCHFGIGFRWWNVSS